MPSSFRLCLAIAACLALPGWTHAHIGRPASGSDDVVVEGELRQWHRVTLTFEGPASSERASPNPFTDYRLTVIFARDSVRYAVPGFFAADGNAGHSGAEAGSAWRVHFAPDAPGTWTYTASFRHGDRVAISDDPEAGRPVAFDGTTGTLEIAASLRTGRDFRGKGRLEYVGERYLRFAGTNERFIKGGTDSPENLLAYAGFDNTAKGKHILHRFTPHIRDWQEDDPDWGDGNGKGLIGALNYLASEGVNAVYFLTMNVQGDGDDVFPWVDKGSRDRFDVSKLAQWEIAFGHMIRNGLMMHVVTQETENDDLLDAGDLKDERRLYYRELVARFAHHPALVWNLGEENTNTDAQRKAFAAYLRSIDPYDHPIVIHTYPDRYDEVYTPLLGDAHIEGPSLQMGDMTKTHAETRKWIARSREAGRAWFVSLDEIGPHTTGVTPDGAGNNHDAVRRFALWGHLMAGGAGVEWYFGYEYPHSDLTLEDFRSRDQWWDYTRFALGFFYDYLPFWEMQSRDDLTDTDGVHVFAKPGEVYAVYLPHGGSATIDLADVRGMVRVRWFNPRTGTFAPQIARLLGFNSTLPQPGLRTLVAPDEDGDWVALIR